ncbi:hypothetical protein ABZX85_37145 [Streptomyces sp. NPDC004539]|uniref:hypothetical protein n=1 Tax=Streptomyces sp. NPDC004539 TaxID=3154280 RepID=UPI0033BED7A8
MRNFTARAISACLRTLLQLLLPASGRRRAPQPLAVPTPAEPHVSPWSRPWTSPSKAEAAAFFRQQAERDLQYERRQAAAYATLGVDYPYTYEGAPFGMDDFVQPTPSSVPSSGARMTREALTSDVMPFGAVCCHCRRWTGVPVPCRHLGGITLHACPDCVLTAETGPTANEPIHNSPPQQRRSA